VSYDQFESSVSGYKAQQTGKRTTERYNHRSVFVNHACRYVYLQLNHSTGGTEAKSAKHNFERIAKESGVQIKAYRAENGIFAKREIASSAAAQNHILTLCGVGSHHQNGIAEIYIRTLTEKARTMLLHAMIPW
jgi:anaerobic ribonucleoside-triphosphate reductase